MLRAKKSLGQHFLRDESIALKIVHSFIEKNPCRQVLEIGPGPGVLTKYFVKEPTIEFHAVEVDARMVELLADQFPSLKGKIIQQDFLDFDIDSITKDTLSIVGNFPYNISSQILFKVLAQKDRMPYVTGMFQKEVARRITSGHGNKEYGILSVLIQAFFNAEYLFEVSEKSFQPPPKVKSAVIRLLKKEHPAFIKDESIFFKVVKAGFGQRRKTLRNSLSQWKVALANAPGTVLEKRAEQLSVEEWIALSNGVAETL